MYTLTRLHPIDAHEFRASLETVAEDRTVALTTLLPALAPMGERAQHKYHAWRTRSHREDELPETFADLLTTVANFADPALSTTTTGQWDPTAYSRE